MNLYEQLNIDLLDQIAVSELFYDNYNEEDILEAFSINIGNFDKNKLHDKKYVNNLIEQINLLQINRENSRKMLKIIYLLENAVITAFNISKYGLLLSLPPALLSAAISLLYIKLLKVTTDNTKINGAKSLIKNMDKQISELEKAKKTANKKELNEINNTINKLQSNKESLNKTIKDEEEKLKNKK